MLGVLLPYIYLCVCVVLSPGCVCYCLCVTVVVFCCLDPPSYYRYEHPRFFYALYEYSPRKHRQRGAARDGLASASMAATATSSPSEPSEALVEQLSFYFTDANLRRDRFMKTFTGADGTGKMPVETLATFNRVKALTQDVGTIVGALRLIPGLQVSDPSEQEGHTVQRTRTLPAKDDSEVGSHLLLSMVARLPTRDGSDGAPASLPCHASGAHGVRRAAAARREPRVDQAALLRLRRLGLG